MLLQRCHSWSKSKLTQELLKTHFYCSINRHLKGTIAFCPRCDQIHRVFRRTSSRRSVSCREKEIRTLYYLLLCIKFDLKPKPVHFVKFETINGLYVTNRLRLYPSIWILLGSILHSLFSSRLSHYRVHKVMLNNTCINNDTVFFLHALVSLPVAMFFFHPYWQLTEGFSFNWSMIMQEMRMAEFRTVEKKCTELDNCVFVAFIKVWNINQNSLQVATSWPLHEITCKNTRNLLTPP